MEGAIGAKSESKNLPAHGRRDPDESLSSDPNIRSARPFLEGNSDSSAFNFEILLSGFIFDNYCGTI